MKDECLKRNCETCAFWERCCGFSREDGVCRRIDMTTKARDVCTKYENGEYVSNDELVIEGTVAV